MSLAAAMNSAASGLFAAGRAAQVVSDNVANALTPGYAARQVDRSSARLGGVDISGITRRETLALITDRRLSQSALGLATARSSAMNAVARSVGAADDPASLTGRFAALSARLIEAQARPDSDIRLGNLQTALDDLVGHINGIGQTIQNERLAADGAIATGVDQLNETLAQVHALNVDIAAASGRGSDANALLDQRRVAIDRIADLVPIREIPRENGSVALMTQGGQLILDSRPARFEFTATNGMSPEMISGAPLSGLAINGQPVDTGRDGGKVSGGRLAALFALRDTALPDAQAQIDSVAHDLAARLGANAVDPTTSAGAAGLLTDAGDALAAAPPPGLAQRLALNAAIDPQQGGAAFRLRDGLDAALPGQSADASLLSAIFDALDARSIPPASTLSASAVTSGGLMDAMLSAATGAAYFADLDATEATARFDAMQRAELAEGVDTDEEMRQLLLVEQAYAANARVIEVAGSMMQRLLEI